MKAIQLNTPAADNAGTRRDAGEKLAVGEQAGEITLDRAQLLVAAASAIFPVTRSRASIQPDVTSDEAE